MRGSGTRPDIELSRSAIYIYIFFGGGKQSHPFVWAESSFCYPKMEHSYQSFHMSLYQDTVVPWYLWGNWFQDLLGTPKSGDAHVPQIKCPSAVGPPYSWVPHSQHSVQRADCGAEEVTLSPSVFIALKQN